MALNQEQLEKQGIYESKAPIASILADFDEIAKFAQVAEARKKWHAKMGGFTMLGGLIVAVAGAVVAPLVPLGVLAIIVGLGWWIYSFFAGGKLVEHPMRISETTKRLKMLQEDASAKAPFTVRLVLDSKPVKVKDEAFAARKDGKQEFFEEQWLTLEGQMLDGTHVSDEVKDLSRKRHYKTPRGKSKSKTRTRYLVTVRLSYPASVYGDARAAEKALKGCVHVNASAQLRSVRVTEKAIAMKALVGLDKEITHTMGMLSVGAYRMLNLARKAVVAGPRGGAK